jgi:hypothetical protein
LNFERRSEDSQRAFTSKFDVGSSTFNVRFYFRECVMSELIVQPSAGVSDLIVPQARMPIAIRQAVVSDLPFIDGLQRKHTKMVGFMPLGQFEGNIKANRILIAEEIGENGAKEPVGYCLGADRYFKRDDVGIIYQMNVMPGRQRSLVGAMLLKSQFERSAYGCKLYCCWCAQDIAANKFWEAMGFVALAFRTGGTGNKKHGPRMHIFWQKRIRQGDESTPWWFPSETSSGAIRENRIVLPIPPGTHWSEAKPLVLPGMEVGSDGELSARVELLPGEKKTRAAKVKKQLVVIKPSAIVSGGLRFGAVVPEVIEEKVEKVKKPKVKNDPKLVAAARELKDRWLEQVNGGLYLPMARGKYEVSRGIGEAEPRQVALFIEPTLVAA